MAPQRTSCTVCRAAAGGSTRGAAQHAGRGQAWLCAWLALGLCLAAQAGWAERVLVRTTTITSLREAVRVYVHSADAAQPGAGFGSLRIPGIEPKGPAVTLPDGSGVVFSTGNNPLLDGGGYWDGHPYTLSAVEPAALRPTAFAVQPEGWRGRAVASLYGPEGEPYVVVLSTASTSKPREDGAAGSVELWRLNPGTDDEPVAVWPLPDEPVDAVLLPGGASAAVLCRRTPGNAAVLHVLDVFNGVPVATPLEAGAWTPSYFESAPAGVALSRGGARLYLLTSGYPLDQGAVEMVSWVHALDTATLTPVANPYEVPGRARPLDAPLQPGDGGRLWVATRAPNAEFAYLTGLNLDSDGFVEEARVPFTGADKPLLVAPAPEGPAVAVAKGNRLELWHDGPYNSRVTGYCETIACLVWDASGLYLGEENRLHEADLITAEPLHTVHFETGIVTEIIPLPDGFGDEVDYSRLDFGLSNGLSQGLGVPDWRWDGMNNHLQPPWMKQPQLDVPVALRFEGKAAGHELRGLLLAPRHGDGWAWSIDVPDDMPWLTVYPRSGTFPDVAYMGVDAGMLPNPLEGARGTVSVQMWNPATGAAVLEPPRPVHVRVTPWSGEFRALWVWPATGPSPAQEVRGLMDRLSRPPYSYRHTETMGMVQEPIDGYDLVVLSAGAAARGALARQPLLDYVTAGGALLVLGRHLPQDDDLMLARLLSPVGIHVNASVPVEGEFRHTVPSADPRYGLARNWDAFEVRGGCAVYTSIAEAVAVPASPGAGQAALAALKYGRGRVAVLAGTTPLEDSQLALPGRLEFAEDLFAWLIEAGRTVEDLDGDGLIDAMEDRKGNMRADAGETDFLNPDSDGDGIPDGLEDRNRNGAVDTGETHPLNPDSDGDGIPDGADLTPVPDAEAPHIARVSPARGPLEGGNRVVVTGRNFGPNVQVWFDGRAASRVTMLSATALIAETPPSAGDTGGPVDVRVRLPFSSHEGLLPNGYEYGDRTAVTLELRTQAPAGPSSEGRVSVHLHAPPGAAAGHVSLVFRAEPGGAAAWGGVALGQRAAHDGRRLSASPEPVNRLRVNLSEGSQTGSGELVTVRYRLQPDADPSAPPHISLAPSSVRVLAPTGAPLDVLIADGDPGSGG